MEFKSTKFEKKDIDMGKRTAVLAYATYNSLDRVNDIVRKGMFTKSITESKDDVRLFLNHDKKQAPGRAGEFWEDSEHGYTKAYLGTHTLGNDTLIMLDEGIITDVSYGFDPVKTKSLGGKKREVNEGKLWEISPLTHWGAHPGSGVIQVSKSFEPSIDFKQLTTSEQDVLRQVIANGQNSIMALVNLAANMETSSDMYTYVMYLISALADRTSGCMSTLKYGEKEVADMRVQLKTMERFVRDTKASDEAIQGVASNIESVKAVISDYDTVDTHVADEPSASVEEKEFADSLILLTLKM